MLSTLYVCAYAHYRLFVSYDRAASHWRVFRPNFTKSGVIAMMMEVNVAMEFGIKVEVGGCQVLVFISEVGVVR